MGYFIGGLSGVMWKVIHSLMYGYAGSVLAGLIVAVIGVALGLSEATVATAAAPTGVVFGMLGLSLVWWRPAVARIRS